MADVPVPSSQPGLSFDPAKTDRMPVEEIFTISELTGMAAYTFPCASTVTPVGPKSKLLLPAGVLEKIVVAESPLEPPVVSPVVPPLFPELLEVELLVHEMQKSAIATPSMVLQKIFVFICRLFICDKIHDLPAQKCGQKKSVARIPDESEFKIVQRKK